MSIQSIIYENDFDQLRFLYTHIKKDHIQRAKHNLIGRMISSNTYEYDYEEAHLTNSTLRIVHEIITMKLTGELRQLYSTTGGYATDKTTFADWCLMKKYQIELDLEDFFFYNEYNYEANGFLRQLDEEIRCHQDEANEVLFKDYEDNEFLTKLNKVKK